jgi:hypothetical protein
LLPPEWSATLCAVDGATTSRLAGQLACVPRDAGHLVVAIGGNDALQNTDLLTTVVRSSSETLSLFAARLAGFEEAYATALEHLLDLGRAVTVCTIYNGALEPERAPIARVGLMTFNDVILRLAFERRLGVIDLRAICSEPGDYTNMIEPSGRGGLKIARAIAHAVGAIDSPVAPSRVWTV